MSKETVRPEFREWIDREPNPGWTLMPLTHVCKGITAQDIVRSGRIEPTECDVFDRALAYFFYGRPAYRLSAEGKIKTAAACPFCFIFDPELIGRSQEIHAFDTGAFDRRMYVHVLENEMNLGDFSLERAIERPNKLIKRAFGTREAYFDGDTSQISDPDKVASQSEFLARAYVDLLRSPGRNEPDDRLCTIEVTFGDPVTIKGALLAVVIPDILWVNGDSPWLTALAEQGVDVLPFKFLIGRDPEHHHALIEQEVREYYRKNEFL